jgi:hypothetical protein
LFENESEEQMAMAARGKITEKEVEQAHDTARQIIDMHLAGKPRYLGYMALNFALINLIEEIWGQDEAMRAGKFLADLYQRNCPQT